MEESIESIQEGLQRRIDAFKACTEETPLVIIEVLSESINSQLWKLEYRLKRDRK